MKDPYKYFKIEAEELLENLTRGLLDLEKKPSDQNLIKTLFRYAHTIKGAANVVKLANFSGLAHKMEDHLALFQDQKKKVSHDDITILLDAVTMLGSIIEAIKRGEPENSVDTDEMLIQLNVNPPDFETHECVIIEDLSQKELPLYENPKLQNVTIQTPDKNGRNLKPEISDSESNIRVSFQKMDQITNLSNEIQINNLRLKKNKDTLRNMVKQAKRIVLSHETVHGTGIKKNFNEFQDHFDNIVTELEHGFERSASFSYEMNSMIMDTRLISVNSDAFFFEKAVRDIAVETNKRISFEIKGKELLLDRALLEKIKEPIYHLLRNSIIHGIESSNARKKAGKSAAGVVRLKFEKHEQSVKIICSDDGQGLNPEKIKAAAIKKNLINKKQADEMSDKKAFYLVLMSGVSTAEILTELSGRGVGMDVVKDRVDSMDGSMDITSKPGQFTCFTLTLPASVNMTDVFMVTAAGQHLLIPLKNVIETRLVDFNEISYETGKKVISFQGLPVSLIPLSDLLGITMKNNHYEKMKVLLVKGHSEKMAIVVDAFGGKKTVLLKPLIGSLQKIGCARFSTILENGDPAFVLSVAEFFNRIKDIPVQSADSKPETIQPSILVTDDSLTTRTLINGILENEGYKVQLAQSGEDALEILARDSFDLFLIDIEMPGINGFELTSKIRQSPKDKETPVIILSSLASDEHKRKGIEVGANAYIVKGSFDQESFLETVGNFV